MLRFKTVEIGVPISLCWGPANFHCLLKLGFQFLCVGARPQLPLPVEFLYEILYVGTPPI
ncbi:hypothetical protein B7474_08095 [Staphylococcus aureus]|nr:hypothetical protein B7474_08095 [Staphylococcus aureus]